MKDYKLKIVNPGLSPKKTAEKAEKLLNQMTAQDWEDKFNSGVMWLLEIEKQ